MPIRVIAAMLLLTFGAAASLAQVPAQPQQPQQQSPEEKAARLRVEKALARLRAIQRAISRDEERQRQLTRDLEKLRKNISEGEAIIAKNEQQVEDARTKHREAGQKVEQLEQQRQSTKEEMDTKRAAIDLQKAIALRGFEMTHQYQVLADAVAEAKAKADAAIKACLERLAQTSEYRTALTTRDSAETRLDEMRSTGDTAQITAASHSAMEAKNRVSLLEDAAFSADPAVVEARAALKEAEDRLAAARAEFEKRWLASAEAAQIRSDAEAAEKAYLTTMKEKTQAEEDRNALSRRVDKMASELTLRKRKLSDAESQADSMESEIERLQSRIQELQVQLSAAQAEHRIAVAELERILRSRSPIR